MLPPNWKPLKDMADETNPEDPKQRSFNINDQVSNYPLGKLTSAKNSGSGMIQRMENPGRIPPQAVEVEQSVLGSILIEPESITEAIELLTEESFYDLRHRHIFRAVMSLFEKRLHCLISH